MKIKKGFRITVTSWENDADHYNTITKDGLSRAEAALVFDMLSLLARSSPYSNMYDPNEFEQREFEQAALAIWKKHNMLVPADWDAPSIEEDDDFFSDSLNEFLNEYTGGGEFYTRVVESVVVEEVEHDIFLNDVTMEFLNV